MMEQSVNPALSVMPFMGVDRGNKSSLAGWAQPVLVGCGNKGTEHELLHHTTLKMLKSDYVHINPFFF